jgi:hypothetical protein
MQSIGPLSASDWTLGRNGTVIEQIPELHTINQPEVPSGSVIVQPSTQIKRQEGCDLPAIWPKMTPLILSLGETHHFPMHVIKKFLWNLIPAALLRMVSHMDTSGRPLAQRRFVSGHPAVSFEFFHMSISSSAHLRTTEQFIGSCLGWIHIFLLFKPIHINLFQWRERPVGRVAGSARHLGSPNTLGIIVISLDPTRQTDPVTPPN